MLLSFYYYYSIVKLFYPYCWTRLSSHTSYFFTVSACVALWNLNPRLKWSYYQLHCSLQDLGLFIHDKCLATHYLEFQTGQPLTLCLLQLEFSRSFLYYAGNFLYYAGIMLYAFQPLLCLKLCQHNRLKPSLSCPLPFWDFHLSSRVARQIHTVASYSLEIIAQ